jgi:hypothetical protein
MTPYFGGLLACLLCAGCSVMCVGNAAQYSSTCAEYLQKQDDQRRATADSAMQTWVGSSAADVIASWGPPSSVTSLSDGRSMYQWDWAGQEFLAANNTEAPNQLARAQKEGWGWCSKWFVVNTAGRVESFHYNGSGGSRYSGCY